MQVEHSVQSKYPVYPKYKESAVAWIDQVPIHWSVLPLFAHFRQRDRRNEGGLVKNLLSLSYGRIVVKDIESNEGLLPESFDGYNIVEPNDIVLRLTDLQNDQRSLRTGRVTEKGIITSAYTTVTPDHTIDPAYASYMLYGYDLLKVFYALGGGVRQGMNYNDLRRLPIVVPTVSEQQAIAAFLDCETAKIDTLIEKQEQLIALLGEKRQAVISQAVTKGLDPNVAMKESGVEWLGEVPVHWNVVRSRYLCSITTGGKDTVDAEEDGEFPFFVRSQTIERISTYSFDGEAVLTAGDGAGVGKVFHHFVGKFDFHQRVYMLANFNGVRGRFIYYYLLVNFYKVALEGGAKSTVDSLRRPMFLDFEVAVPPPHEQDKILEHINQVVTRFDCLVNKAGQSIALMREHRAALISAAVTGKIDVRSIA